MMEGRDMCDYCEKHHFLAVNDVTNSRGVTTEIGISITGNQISTEEKRFVRSGSMIGYKLLAHGAIRFCPMCGDKLMEG